MATTLAPGLARKVKKILEIKTESSEFISSLSVLSTFYDRNTPAARRSLRSTIEKRGLEISDKFLHAAESVIKALDDVQSNLDGLSVSCSTINATLVETKSTTAQLINETERLYKSLENVERKSQWVHEFLEQYQLTQDEILALQSEDVSPAFFSALSRVRQIHEHCRTLLRTHHQRAGLELMDAMAGYQETAYEKLCRWVQSECRGMVGSDAPEVSPALSTAVAALRQRPVLFRYCAEEVAGARHGALFTRFITALTRGGPGGVPRPIEIHAHDPARYVNDMLAWVHQALAGEREMVGALFGEEARARPEGEDDDMGGMDQSDALSAPALLDRIFESICRPLKVRIEQVLMSTPPLLLCFQLSQLLSFYLSLVARDLGQRAALSVTLRATRDMANRVFYDQLRARGEKLTRTPPPPPKDLSPPPQVAETVHQLFELVSAYESSLQCAPLSSSAAGGATSAPAADEALEPVVAAVLEPLVTMCEKSAEALAADAPSRVDEVSRLDPSAYRVYLINCLTAISASLGQRAAASRRAVQLGEAVEGHVAALVGGEVGRLLARCGLSEVLGRLALYGNNPGSGSAPHGARPADDPALALNLIVDAMRAFFVIVSSPDALPEFLDIKFPRTRAECVARVARSLVSAYETAYKALEDPSNGYTEHGGVSSVRHNPAQVRTILGVI